jgi:hypothetical protein
MAASSFTALAYGRPMLGSDMQDVLALRLQKLVNFHSPAPYPCLYSAASLLSRKASAAVQNWDSKPKLGEMAGVRPLSAIILKRISIVEIWCRSD